MLSLARLTGLGPVDAAAARVTVGRGRPQRGRQPPRRRVRACTSRRIPPASAPRPSAATSPRTPAAPTACATASPCSTCAAWTGSTPGAGRWTTGQRRAARPGPGPGEPALRQRGHPRRGDRRRAGPRARCPRPRPRCWPSSPAWPTPPPPPCACWGAGLLPVAVEMVDRAMLRAVEEAFAFGFPTDVDAVMIAEFAGPRRGGGRGRRTRRRTAARRGRPRGARWPPTRTSAPACGPAARRPSAPWAAWRPATSPWTWWCPWAR